MHAVGPNFPNELGVLDPANGFRIRHVFRVLALLVGGGFSVVALLVSASALQMGQ